LRGESENSHCHGVDLEQNFELSDVDSSNDECSDFYHGPYAYSEPEAKLLSNFLLKPENNIQMLVSLTGYGSKLWYSSSTHEVEDCRDIARFASRGSNFSFSLKHKTSSFENFARDRAKIKYILQIQAQDDKINGPFVPSISIEERANEVLRIVKRMAKKLHEMHVA
jgi:hypothetical protein